MSKKRDRIFNFSNKCEMCSLKLQNIDPTKFDYMQIDHLRPVAKGGKNSIDNLRPLCKSCNSSKGNRDSLDIALKIKNDADAIFKNYHINLIRYEIKNNVFEKDLVINTLEKAMFTFLENINMLLKECK